MLPSEIVFIIFLPIAVWSKFDCSQREYNRCIRMADPLVKEPHLIFPDNKNDIDTVCRTWNRLVDCLKIYTEECFNDQQRRTFNKAVESPIESVHQMCMQPSYQEEYLQYAPCLKTLIIDKNHCGSHYSLLVDQVSQGDIISKTTLCCSHDRFKECVQRETKNMCDRGINDGPATVFARQIIDKALNFLRDQCLNYIPGSGDCTTLVTDFISHSDPQLISTSSSENYPWSTVERLSAKEIVPTRSSVSKGMSSTWLPNRDSSVSSDTTSTHVLGSRSRPASYGRASGWTEYTDSPTKSHTFQMTPESSFVPTSSKPAWSTSWNDVRSSNTPDESINRNEVQTTPSRQTTSETWYPAAGNQINNEVDEPNQLGLKKPRNTGILISFSILTVALSVLPVIL